MSMPDQWLELHAGLLLVPPIQAVAVDEADLDLLAFGAIRDVGQSWPESDVSVILRLLLEKLVQRLQLGTSLCCFPTGDSLVGVDVCLPLAQSCDGVVDVLLFIIVVEVAV